METLNKNILLAGEVVAKKWKIVEKIGEGTFSQIYSAYAVDSDERVAIKVEAPSALKPVLEWEATILKNLQKCPHVCRYYYHGKHAESTVLVMELLGESMSMLRVTPEAINGVPISKCVSVGLEMLDCIHAFHKHGYVHRDIKASNFALTAGKTGSSSGIVNNRRYLLIDFGLSRQHIDDGKVIAARAVAEFRGTSMYASLSAHRRLELGPKDDLWSWFYLVLDFMRGELPWAADAQQKNRQMVFQLKEYYTEKHPGLLVEGLPGASHLLAIVKYLMSLTYDDKPNYKILKDRLKRVADGADGEDTIELWDALGSYRERVLQWTTRANDALEKKADFAVLDTLHEIAKKYDTFFDSEGLSEDEHMAVQEAVFNLEKRLRETTTNKTFAPPPIQSFKRRQESEQKIRTDAIRKRRERDQQVRQSLEQKLRRQSSTGSALAGVIVGSPANDIASGSATPTRIVSMTNATVHKSEDSAMECSDSEEDVAKARLPSTSSRTPPLPPRCSRPLSATRFPPPPSPRHSGSPVPVNARPSLRSSSSEGMHTSSQGLRLSVSAVPARVHRQKTEYEPCKNEVDRGYARRGQYERETSSRQRSSYRSRSRSRTRSRSRSRSRSPTLKNSRNHLSLRQSRRDYHRYSLSKSPVRSSSRSLSHSRTQVRSRRSRSRSRSGSSLSRSKSPPQANVRYLDKKSYSKLTRYNDRSGRMNHDSYTPEPSPEHRNRVSK